MNHVAVIIWFNNALSIRAGIYNNMGSDAMFRIKSVSEFQSANGVCSENIFWSGVLCKLQLFDYNNNVSANVPKKYYMSLNIILKNTMSFYREKLHHFKKTKQLRFNAKINNNNKLNLYSAFHEIVVAKTIIKQTASQHKSA